jgi:hypothetical protein
MAEQFWRTEKGFDVNDSIWLSGAVAPGAAGDSQTVGVASIYTDTVGAALYLKTAAGAGVGNWKQMATEDFVNSVVNGLGSKKSARLATDAALPANTSTGSGVGKILTADVNGTLTVDGSLAALNDIILVKNEGGVASNSDNGIYDLTDAGSGGTPWVLTRRPDFDEATEVEDGALVFIGEGTNNLDTAWLLITDNPIVVDTTALEFVKFPTDITSIEAELANIRSFIGKAASGVESPAYSSNNYVVDTTSLETAIGVLDNQLGLTQAQVDDAYTEVSADNLAAATNVDTVLVDVVSSVFWEVYVRGNAGADQNKLEVFKIMASHDGTPSGDAVTAKHNVIGKLKFGSLGALGIDVVLVGAGGAQTMALEVTPGAFNVDVRAIRRVDNF